MPRKETIGLNKQLRQYMQITGKGKDWYVTNLAKTVTYIKLTSKAACQEWLDNNYSIA